MPVIRHEKYTRREKKNGGCDGDNSRVSGAAVPYFVKKLSHLSAPPAFRCIDAVIIRFVSEKYARNHF